MVAGESIRNYYNRLLNLGFGYYVRLNSAFEDSLNTPNNLQH